MIPYSQIKFEWPYILLLLLFLPIILYFYIRMRKNRISAIIYSSFDILPKYKKSLKEKIIWLPDAIRFISIACIIVAIARPYLENRKESVYSEGIDIAIVLDISGTMLAQDLKPNRLEAAKKVIKDFIDSRTNDRIALVVFSKDAFTQCPLTFDYNVVKRFLSDVQSGFLEDGTAIGNAIANGVNRLKDSKAKSKVMILATDGMNNAGEIEPMMAAKIAAQYGIRIYTIGVGKNGLAPFPVQTPFGIQYQSLPVEIDETLLKNISQKTGGVYYRSVSNEKLQEVYSNIDKLERTKSEKQSYNRKNEVFTAFLFPAVLLILLEFILRNTYFKKIP